MLDTILKSFDLELKKQDHFFESAVDAYRIKSQELYSLKALGYYGESTDDEIFSEATSTFMSSLKEFFDNSVKTFHSLIIDAVDKTNEDLDDRNTNKILDDIAKASNYIDSFADKYPDIMHKYIHDRPMTVTVEVIQDHIHNLKEYITTATREINKTYLKEYTSVYEYEKARLDCSKRLNRTASKLHLKNSYDDTWDAEYDMMTIRDAVRYVKSELEKRESIARQFKEAYNSFIKQMREIIDTEDDISRIIDIKSEISKVTRVCSHTVKHTMEQLNKLANSVVADSIWVLKIAEKAKNNKERE